MTIRTAGLRDAAALHWLALLDSAPPLAGRVLVAEQDGAPIAALSVQTGAALADPSQPAGDTVHLLRRRRYQISQQSGMTAGWRLGGALLSREPLVREH